MIVSMKELQKRRFDYGVLYKVPCIQEEEEWIRDELKANRPMPEGYARDPENHFAFVKFDPYEMTKAEIDELLMYRRTEYVRTIKNVLVFFAVLAVISLVVGLLALLGMISAFLGRQF